MDLMINNIFNFTVQSTMMQYALKLDKDADFDEIKKAIFYAKADLNEYTETQSGVTTITEDLEHILKRSQSVLGHDKYFHILGQYCPELKFEEDETYLSDEEEYDPVLTNLKNEILKSETREEFVEKSLKYVNIIRESCGLPPLP
jgi:hypothetical protein